MARTESSESYTARWKQTMTRVDRAGRPEIKKWYHEQRAKRVIESLRENHVKGYYASDRQEAFSIIMGMIPKDAVISFGDSVTLYELGIISELSSGKYNFLNPWESGIDGEESMERRRRALLVDVFLSGINAITLDGKLVCMSGLGNNIAGMVFGPKKVIIAVGANKIVPNVEQALVRIRDIAAPLNAKRHNKEVNSCGRDAYCLDYCNAPRKQCQHLHIIHGEDPLGYPEPRLHVVIVGEELGY
ncbi:lactate utilization protein [Chloroflexota bacterium]